MQTQRYREFHSKIFELVARRSFHRIFCEIAYELDIYIVLYMSMEMSHDTIVHIIRIVENAEELNHGKRSLPGTHTIFEMKNIQQHVEYQFWITAVTKVGEGLSSSVVAQVATSKSKLFTRIPSIIPQF